MLTCQIYPVNQFILLMLLWWNGEGVFFAFFLRNRSFRVPATLVWSRSHNERPMRGHLIFTLWAISFAYNAPFDR